jgi:hypothetical protein
MLDYLEKFLMLKCVVITTCEPMEIHQNNQCQIILIMNYGRVLPHFERAAWLRDRMVRVTSGSLRLIARKAVPRSKA